MTIKRALISVANKSKLLPLAKKLQHQQVEIISSGGTAKFLSEHQIPHITVSSVTDFPEIMGGRVKTLHPKIHGGILARRDIDQETVADFGIGLIDLVVVNCYPFLDQPNIENIDIGGPALIRAAAKNHQWVTVLTDPNDYHDFINQFDTIDVKRRQQYAHKAFQHTAIYDQAIADYLTDDAESTANTSVFPEKIKLELNKVSSLRYGENPHQEAAIYHPKGLDSSLYTENLQGKALSYNNLLDAQAAFKLVSEFSRPTCAIVKHNNPCGVATAETSLIAYHKAYSCDEQAAFGGIVAFNTPLDPITALTLIEQQFVEVLLAPGFDEKTKEIFKQKPNLRVVDTTGLFNQQQHWQMRSLLGSVLLQQADKPEMPKLEAMTSIHPKPKQLLDCELAWKVAKHVKSNAIVIASDEQTIGIGAGQMSRIASVEIAINNAKQFVSKNKSFKGDWVMASDAFFPFADNVALAAMAGIKTIIQPGGSKRDHEVIEACKEHDIALLFTHQRHFSH